VIERYDAVFALWRDDADIEFGEELRAA